MHAHQCTQHSFSGSEVYCTPLPPSLFDVTYADARRRFSSAIVLGVVTASDADAVCDAQLVLNTGMDCDTLRTLRINPPDDIVLRQGDELLALAPSAADLIPSASIAPEYAAALEQLRTLPRSTSVADTVSPPVRLALLSMGDPTVTGQALVQVLQYVSPGSHVAVVINHPASECEPLVPVRAAEAMQRLGVTCAVLHGRCTDVGLVQEVLGQGCNRLLLMPQDAASRQVCCVWSPFMKKHVQ